MNAATTLCPSCRFENHVTSRFCIKCGAKLPESAVAAPAPAPGLPDPPVSTDAPEASTGELLQQIAQQSGCKVSRTKAGWSLQVPLADDRRQVVYVIFDGQDDDGQDVISFLSVCGRVDERLAMKLLEANAKLAYCAFAVRKIRGEDYFVVTASQLASTADPDEVRKSISAVAKQADRLESRLAGSEDKF